jgi:simple sugar transport system permease protein
MSNQIFQAAIIASILASTIRLATPLLLAALGELVTERSGIMNLGVEGMMLLSAFTSFMITYVTGSLWSGVLAAIVTGGLMALLMAFMAITLKVEQIVTGMALNLLGAGISLFWLRLMTSTAKVDVLSGDIFNPLERPGLSTYPSRRNFLLPSLADLLRFLLVPVIWFLVPHQIWTPNSLGGRDRRAVDTKGVNVARLQYLATIFGGMMAGLAGSFLTLAASPRFVAGISGGRGWLAIVIVIAGNWLPWRITLAALVFAFLDALQLHIQGVGVQIPYQILLALPYVFAIIAMMTSRARSEAPSSLGVPYTRE